MAPILDFNESLKKGMLFDTRDGQSYQVVKIGKQIWLAENFRYLPSLEKGDKYCNSWVYNNDNSYLEKGYGRLYDWFTAMSIAPEGWKLPSSEDFNELRDFIIKDNKLGKGSYQAGSYLKSVNGWDPWAGIKPNNDKYGFNAKPAGYYYNDSSYFNNASCSTSFWSATEIGNNCWYLFYFGEGFRDYSHDIYGCTNSVRLIKDSL